MVSKIRSLAQSLSLAFCVLLTASSQAHAEVHEVVSSKLGEMEASTHPETGEKGLRIQYNGKNYFYSSSVMPAEFMLFMLRTRAKGASTFKVNLPPGSIREFNTSTVKSDEPSAAKLSQSSSRANASSATD